MRPLLAAVLCAALLLTPARSSATSLQPSGVNAWAAGNTATWLVSARYAAAIAAAETSSRPRSRPPRTTRISSPTQYAGTGTVNGYPCGGHLPPCYVLARESGGNPTARNPRSTASGLWQFLDSTWAGFGGYARAYLAPPSVQNAKAVIVWADGAGCHAWGAC